MTAADADLGMALKRQAGWNQTPQDWQRFIALAPNGCFVANEDGRDIATVTTTTFGTIAWIAMVLVDESMRGRGVGKAVLNHAIAHLESQSVQSIRLDATPMGRPLYEKLGFVAQFDLARYAGKPSLDAPTTTVEQTDDRDAILALDRTATATPREALIASLIHEHPDQLRIAKRNGALRGYITARPGENATQIGPCIADALTGESLLTDALHRHCDKPVYIDVPVDHASAVRIVEAADLTQQRILTRMTRGKAVNEDIQKIWASSGPEKG